MATGKELTKNQKADRFDAAKKRETKAKIVESHFMQNVWVGGSAVAMTGIVAFILSKVPRIRYFTKDQKVPTVPVIMIPTAFAGLLLKSPAVFGGALGPLLHFWGSWIEQQSWAQPKTS